MSSAPPRKRVRRELDLKQKVDMIKDARVKPKPTQKFLSDKYGVGTSTVSDILKKADTYIEQYENNASGNKKRFDNVCKFDKVNTLIWEWFQKAREQNYPLSGPIVQAKATEFAQTLGVVDFKASNGWMTSFKSRHSIKGYAICGEKADVDTNIVDDFITRAPTLVDGYSPKDVFNCDETGLYFRALPDKTLATKSDARKGGKMSKERLTVMLACSASGEKLKPLVIGKARQPRCFKKVKVDRLPVTWVSNAKAWMTSTLFKDWVNDVNKQMRKQKRKIILFLDNATSHTHDKLSNVTLKFLPPNTTSAIQPLDQGIIRAVKARYRKLLMVHLLAKMDDNLSANKLAKSITVLDAVNWVSAAWEDTKPSTIISCFKHCGFPTPTTELEDDPEDDLPLASFISQVTQHPLEPEAFINIDEGVSTEDTDNWEAALVAQHMPPTDTTDSDSDSDSETPTSPAKPKLSRINVQAMLEELTHYAHTEDESFLTHVNKLTHLNNTAIAKKRINAKQCTLNDFFIKH